MQSQLTGGQVRIWSDNVGVTRWLQKTIETLLFPAFADTSLPAISGYPHVTVPEASPPSS